MGSLLRATNLWGYDQLVRQLGADPEPLLARFHIPPAADRPDDAFIPYRSAALLLETSAARLDCPDFSLRLVAWQGLEILGPVAVIARNSNTVLESFETIGRYLYIHCPALRLRRVKSSGAGPLRFDFQITELELAQKRQAYELSLANAMQILRLLGGRGARPRLLSFMHSQIAEQAVYEAAFGCPVLFDQPWCGWEMSRESSHQAIDHADAQTRTLAASYLESRYAPGVAPLSVRVTELIRRLLPTGQCNADTIARELAMHPRTLQRRLAEEGERYDALLNQERKEQAQRYLSQPGLHLSQITGLLGYAEQSAFNRSCRRWFGTTPKEFRKRIN